MFPLLRLLFCLLSVANLPGSAWAASPVDILRFNALVEIHAEDSVTVTEEIKMRTLASGVNRGLFRDIPVNARWQDKGRQKVEIQVKAVLIDGKTQPVDDMEEHWPFLRIYMRDKNAYLEAGTHTFVLQYDMTQQIGFFAKQDELTWNVTGSGWDGIDSSLCMVLPPPGAAFTDHQAWLGYRGEQTSPVVMGSLDAKGRKALLFKTKRPIRPGEDFTVAVAWPKGFCKEPAQVKPEEEVWFTLSLAVLLLIVSVASGLIWFKFGKDPNVGGPVIPLFYPPKLPARLAGKKRRDERLSAAAVNYIWNKGVLTSQGLAALFLALAERGDCKAYGDAKNGFTLQGIQSSSSAPEEAAAAARLKGELHLNNPDGETLSAIEEACVAHLDQDYQGLWKQHLAWIGVISALPLLGLSLLLRWNLGPYQQWPPELGSCALTALFAALFAGAAFWFALCFQGLVRLALLLAATVLSAALTTLVGWMLFGGDGVLWIFSPLQLLLMGAILGVPTLFAAIMDAPSLEAAKLRQEISGLALYIGTAEAERLNFANPPDKPLALYHRLLPYAVALGLEQAWGERFAAEIANAEATTPATQSFLTSREAVYALAGAVDACLATHAASLHAASRSSDSSFGGGGGGAGSGGGGGGGGAC